MPVRGALFGQALQGVLEVALFAHVAQATAQHVEVEAAAHQPVADTGWFFDWLLVEQQDDGQGALVGLGKTIRGTQQQTAGVIIEQVAGRFP